jgi:hypothetical protein
MSPRLYVVAALLFWAAALVMQRFEHRAAEAFSHHADDVAGADGLLASRAELETSVLEARAGLQLNFDGIDRAVLSLRAGPRLASLVRSRGPVYARAADTLDRLSEAMQVEEAALETFKSDLALLRLSSRYFPSAADALSRPDAATSRALGALRAAISRLQVDTDHPQEVDWRIRGQLAALAAARSSADSMTAKVGALRADVERFEEMPTREVADRIDAEMQALTELRSSLSESVQADLTVLLGHTRAIVDRRERVDRTARAIARSSVRHDAEAALTAYEYAARSELAVARSWRIGVYETAAAAVLSCLAALWVYARGWWSARLKAATG